jgi:hypothetical protein
LAAATDRIRILNAAHTNALNARIVQGAPVTVVAAAVHRNLLAIQGRIATTLGAGICVIATQLVGNMQHRINLLIAIIAGTANAVVNYGRRPGLASAGATAILNAVTKQSIVARERALRGAEAQTVAEVTQSALILVATGHAIGRKHRLALSVFRPAFGVEAEGVATHVAGNNRCRVNGAGKVTAHLCTVTQVTVVRTLVVALAGAATARDPRTHAAYALVAGGAIQTIVAKQRVGCIAATVARVAQVVSARIVVVARLVIGNAIERLCHLIADFYRA